MNDTECDPVNGTCALGLCAPGWTGDSCDTSKSMLQNVYTIYSHFGNSRNTICMNTNSVNNSKTNIISGYDTLLQR